MRGALNWADGVQLDDRSRVPWADKQSKSIWMQKNGRHETLNSGTNLSVVVLLLGLKLCMTEALTSHFRSGKLYRKWWLD